LATATENPPSSIEKTQVGFGWVANVQNNTGIAAEQAQTFIAKGRTLTLEEFEYAPES
jgi:hypothetical protein